MNALLSLTVRDWMVVIGSLLIVAVLADAWRRMRLEKRSRVRVKLLGETDGDAAPVDEISVLHELPNGGARVLKREDLIAAREHHDAEVAAAEASARAADGAGDGDAAEPVPASPRPPRDHGGRARVRQRDDRAVVDPGADRDDAGAQDPDPMAGMRSDRDGPGNLDWLEDLPDSPAPADDDAQGGSLPRSVETEVIILNVVANEESGFDGKAILEILLACDLRFGDMDFFHRHEREAGRGPIQFSVANMLKPGVFDIDNMGAMRTRGLVFFLTLPGPEDMVRAFDYMLETARTVARNLNGEVLDESRSVLTEQSVEHARQQIRDLERRMLAQPR